MKCFKISNFIKSNGDADYKGLNINQFIAGSQAYDFENSVCLVKTREDSIPSSPDLQVLTEKEYNETKDIINSNSPAVQEETKIENLEKKQEVMQKAIDDLIFGGAL
ncbi:hypothetical protein [Virgibacillus halodenitrificans]|uniref:hypothetical protein n=1 Tax=Virgibacillus halodenitrificans TaxID=1482 RepID=UPI000EF4E5BF|nr:hypothetical protein [Virgibacillus halodenitrificans]